MHPRSGTDSEVIQAVLQGDIERYAELVDRYQRAALKLAFGFLGNYEDAKDVAQEAFVSAYSALGHFQHQAKFSTWLYRIVINKCKDFCKRRCRTPLVVASVGTADPELDGVASLFVDVADPSADPRDQLSNRELGKHLTRAIEALPTNQRAAFVLHHLQGIPVEEVAGVMGCRVGTVKSHLFRATAHLRIQLAPWLAHEQEG